MPIKYSFKYNIKVFIEMIIWSYKIFLCALKREKAMGAVAAQKAKKHKMKNERGDEWIYIYL